MRIRKQVAGAFVAIFLFAAFAGLAPADSKYKIPTYRQSDKALHFITFFLLTLTFYWILETTRRRTLQITLIVCPVILGLGSEVVQGVLPNGRDFDPYDIVANEAGSCLALALCTWYHKRMLERKRAARGSYLAVPGAEPGDVDVELGEGVGGASLPTEGQETGVVGEPRTVEEELDNWDENAEDWDEAEVEAEVEGADGAATAAVPKKEEKKRSD